MSYCLILVLKIIRFCVEVCIYRRNMFVSVVCLGNFEEVIVILKYFFENIKYNMNFIVFLEIIMFMVEIYF